MAVAKERPRAANNAFCPIFAAKLKLWYLSLPKHANLPDGIPYNGIREQGAEKVWREHGLHQNLQKPLPFEKHHPVWRQEFLPPFLFLTQARIKPHPAN